ncbi:MAG: DUF4249 domain-containing protein [Bacteroidota bacterium]
MKKYFFFIITIVLLNACEDKIDLDLPEDGSQLVVDAWINNKSETQVIKLRRTIPYFDNTFAPEVTGATIVVADSDSTLFFFEDNDNDGDYTWTPGPGETLVQEGKDYGLFIELDGDEYISISKANRTALVDSISYESREDLVGQPDGIYATLFARDRSGEGDVYWIKTFKNGEYLNKPQELNIAYDGAFGPGANSDGILFIVPIREAINRVPDFEDDAVDDADVPPYAIGDSLRVEVHSLTQEAFFFLLQAREQMTQGDNGIFATPITNVPSNIVAQSADAKEEPVGFFNAAIVATTSKVIE